MPCRYPTQGLARRSIATSALTHADPARATLLAHLREHPISPAGPLLPQRAYTTGTTQLTPDVAAEMPAWARAGVFPLFWTPD
jgi:hypothetical protein